MKISGLLALAGLVTFLLILDQAVNVFAEPPCFRYVTKSRKQTTTLYYACGFVWARRCARTESKTTYFQERETYCCTGTKKVGNKCVPTTLEVVERCVRYVTTTQQRQYKTYRSCGFMLWSRCPRLQYNVAYMRTPMTSCCGGSVPIGNLCVKKNPNTNG